MGKFQDGLSFREAIEFAEANGELVRITKPVEPFKGIPRVSVELCKRRPSPVILFENIEGFDGFKACAAMFSDKERIARFFNFPSEGFEGKMCYLKALENPIPPKVVETGPCKENIVTGDIDIEKLIPSHQGAQCVNHKYYQPVVVTKHPRTGEVNVGIFRSSIQSKNEVTVNARWNQHIGLQLSAAKEEGVPFPVALCIGVAPGIYVAGCAKMDYGFNEFEFAGALMNKPVELVKCETVYLEVPAESEIVIEGVIEPPYKHGNEGPWPEYLKYLGMNIKPPMLRITAVTHRNDPINNMFVPGGVPHILGMGTQAQLFKRLRNFAGEFVRDSWLTPATVFHHAVVKVKKTEAHHEGLQTEVGFAALSLGSAMVDTVTLVDDDINIYDYSQIDWAVATRCNPAKQVHILPEARSHQNNPIAGVNELFDEPIVRGKMIVDATIPWKYRVAEKSPGLTYFTLSSWDSVDLREYLDKESLQRWS